MFSFLKKLFGAKTAAAPGPMLPLVANPSGLIIAAKVTKVEKHPNADRLRIVQVWDGTQERGPIVCGAFNFEVGDIVALALPGATIAHNIHSDAHESFVLGTAKIRGIESQGMICAAFELGIIPEVGDKPEIMVLPGNTAPGAVLA
jgi:phenylalanyl-tRNA synthetase beta chain